MKYLLFLVIFAFGFSFSATALDIQPSPLTKKTRTVIKKAYPHIAKKVILYNADLIVLPTSESQEFFKKVNQLMTEPKVKKIYDLKEQPDAPEDIKDYDDWAAFKRECGNVCVVSFKHNWIYKIVPSGKKPEIEFFMDALDTLAYQ